MSMEKLKLFDDKKQGCKVNLMKKYLSCIDSN